MTDQTLSIVLAVIGSGCLTAFVSGGVSLISKHLDRKKGITAKISVLEQELAETKKELKETKQDLARIQLMLLISDYPNATTEILQAAERYFRVLGGNFYMDTLFSKWLNDNNIPRPTWFNHN